LQLGIAVLDLDDSTLAKVDHNQSEMSGFHAAGTSDGVENAKGPMVLVVLMGDLACVRIREFIHIMFIEDHEPESYFLDPVGIVTTSHLKYFGNGVRSLAACSGQYLETMCGAYEADRSGIIDKVKAKHIGGHECSRILQLFSTPGKPGLGLYATRETRWSRTVP
jgi:hypothetical protein